MKEHWYGILPNGGGYMVNWFTEMKSGDICMVPAGSDKIRFGSEESLETATDKAIAVAGGDYDIILYKRMTDDPAQEDYYRFIPDKTIRKGGDK